MNLPPTTWIMPRAPYIIESKLHGKSGKDIVGQASLFEKKMHYKRKI